MARTMKKTAISPAKNSRNPNRRRRRRSGRSLGVGARLIGAAAATAFAVTADLAAATMGTAVTAGVAAAVTGSTLIAGVAGTACWMGGFVSVRSGAVAAPAWVAAAPPFNSCSFALAGLTGAVTGGIAGTGSCTGGFVRLASRSCSFALSAIEAGSCGWVPRQGRRRIWAPP